LEIYENMPHVFQLGADFVPEVKRSGQEKSPLLSTTK
jgi:hypothetical protein